MKSTNHYHTYLRIIGLGLLAVTLYMAKDVLLILFASVLGAIFFHRLATEIKERSGLGYQGSVTVVMVTLLAALALFVWLVGPELVQQSSQLGSELPKAVTQARDKLDNYPALQRAWELVSTEMSGAAIEKPLEQARVVFSGAMGLLSGLLLLLASTVYLAFQPGPYSRGFGGVLKKILGYETGANLKQDLHGHLWGFLVAQLQTMLVLGVLTTIGLWLIGMPNFIALGTLAGLFAFVPVIGPLFSVVPALLIALTEGPQMMAYVAILYLGIQLLESNLITPVLQQRNSSLPPVLTLAFQAILGSVCGVLGVFVAAPMAVVAMVLGQYWMKPYKGDEDSADGAQ